MKYTIKKGSHSSGLHFCPTYVNKSFNFAFKIEQPNEIARTGADDFDTSKLYGFSYGYHHHNSIRLGFVHDYDNPTQYHLMLYYYNKANKDYKGTYSKDGAIIKKLVTCKYGKYYYCNFTKMSIVNMKVDILNTDLKALVTESFLFKQPSFKLGYKLYPYYGGNAKAPVDFKFDIKH